MSSIDLNADLGEGFPNDARLLELVSSTSLCCGVHAASPAIIINTLTEAVRLGRLIGAHPGYDDREGFGQRDQHLTSMEVERLVCDQVALLGSLGSSTGKRVHFVKPHGALYNQAQVEPTIARGVISGVKSLGLPLLGLPNSLLERLATEAGVRYIAEGFPERRYGPDGRLVPRSEPNAVLHDQAEVADQVMRLVDQGVITLCIHGDDPDAVRKAETVRGVLERHGVRVAHWNDE